MIVLLLFLNIVSYKHIYVYMRSVRNYRLELEHDQKWDENEM